MITHNGRITTIIPIDAIFQPTISDSEFRTLCAICASKEGVDVLKLANQVGQTEKKFFDNMEHLEGCGYIDIKRDSPSSVTISRL